METIGILITGGLAGWIAGTLIRGAGYGLVLNIVVGAFAGWTIAANFTVLAAGSLRTLMVVGALAIVLGASPTGLSVQGKANYLI